MQSWWVSWDFDQGVDLSLTVCHVEIAVTATDTQSNWNISLRNVARQACHVVLVKHQETNDKVLARLLLTTVDEWRLATVRRRHSVPPSDNICSPRTQFNPLIPDAMTLQPTNVRTRLRDVTPTDVGDVDIRTSAIMALLFIVHGDNRHCCSCSLHACVN